jgi:hypothetical protein
MSGEGSQGNREVPQLNPPLEEGGSWGKHGFPHGSEPKASDAHGRSSRRPSTIMILPAHGFWASGITIVSWPRS